MTLWEVHRTSPAIYWALLAGGTISLAVAWRWKRFMKASPSKPPSSSPYAGLSSDDDDDEHIPVGSCLSAGDE
jgi:hypothetical protein